jgi:hypothetical protein
MRLRFIAFAALGPVTGPLLAGVLRHRRSAPALAALYALALALWWGVLPAIGAALLHALRRP